MVQHHVYQNVYNTLHHKYYESYDVDIFKELQSLTNVNFWIFTNKPFKLTKSILKCFPTSLQNKYISLKEI